MKNKEFKAESKRLMDLMINSIYTNKDIFLREIISNASDAIDKLHYRSLTDKNVKIDKKKLEIVIKIDKEKRTITIGDNGCGMTKEELENNLGTIAKSGSFDFKEENEKKKNIDIIGQFGVGFYSVFMTSSLVKVVSKAYGSDDAYTWQSSGISGYSINKADKESYGTDVILTIKEDTEDENYSKYLDEFNIKDLIKKYSDYITYPIKLITEEDNEGSVINSLIPLWKRDKKNIKEEEYNVFYKDKFFDYEDPIARVHTKAEGLLSFNSLLYIPSHAPYDYYTKEFEKGLQLYSNGVLIMEKCGDLLPDYFSFVKGVVDSPDLSLNISREILQQNTVLNKISSNLEKKIKTELSDILENRREDYIKFYKAFGMQIKFGIYNSYGMNNDKLKDLLIFYSANKKDYVTLDEYVKSMKEDQKAIYYACGESIDKINMLPQIDSVIDSGYDILYLTEYVDEFTIKVLNEYDNKKFINICSSDFEANSKPNDEIEKINEKNKDLLSVMKSALEGVSDVKFTNNLKKHPVCLSSKGDVSIEMEKVMNALPNDSKVKADIVLEINSNHEIANKLKELYKSDKSSLEKYSKVLYNQARLIEGLSIENPAEISAIICEFLAK